MKRVCSSLLVFGAIANLHAQTPISGQPVPQLSIIDTLIPQLMSKWSSPGAAVAITKDGRLVYARGFGFADTATNEPVQPDSLFRIASISKPLTAAAILKLIEQGKLQLSTTPFTGLLSGLKPPLGQTEDARVKQITIQNLLEHTAGWDDTITGVPDPVFAYADVAAQTFNVTPPATPDVLISYMLGQPLQHNPGVTYAYSNFGYVVLGQVIQYASGQAYGDYLTQNVLAPASIQRTQLGKSLLNGRAANEVMYYDYPGAPLVSSVLPPLTSMVPFPYGGFALELLAANGGWIASTMDLLRYVDTMNGQLLPAILQSPPPGFVSYVPPVGNGWGWVFYGSLPGTNTLLHLDTGYQVNGRVSWAVLFNTRSGTNISQPETDADAQMLQAIQSIAIWPTNDLFSTYNTGSSACAFSLTAGSVSSAAAGGSGSVYLTDANNCAWNTLSSASWLTVTSSASGFDSAAINYSIAPNPSTASRTATITIGGQIFTVTQAGTAASNALGFVPVTPCRIADTRNPAGPFGAPALAALSVRNLIIPNSACGIPATAQAYSVNVTVVPQGPLGYITVWPAGQTQPLVSTLNSGDGRVKSNAAIVPAGANGAISLFATNITDVVLDIDGYFVPAGNTGALSFYPLTPCRIADTRNPSAPLGGPYISSGQSKAFPVQSAACGIPASAQAYSLNFTAVPHGSLGYLTVWPTGLPQPYVSTLNAPTATVTANAAIVPAGTSGSINAFATNDTDLVIDANGYFAPAGNPGALSLYNFQPCRVLDTRVALPGTPFSGVFNINVAGSSCGVPAAAQSYVFNTTVVPSSGLAYLTLWPRGVTQPGISSLNAADGAVTSNMAIVPTSDGFISAYATQSTHLILDVFGYFAP